MKSRPLVWSLSCRRKSRFERTCGITLVELVVAMAVSSVIVVGLASAVSLASRAVEGPTGATATVVATGEAVDRMASDLRVALRFSERTATAVTMSVPDQTGDGVSDSIRYAWSGSGQPLTRSLNGATAVAVIDDVRGLNLLYRDRPATAAVVESGNLVLSNYTLATASSVTLTSTSEVCQTFTEACPPNAVSWALKRVRLRAARVSGAGNVVVQIFAADAARRPTGSQLAMATLATGALPSTMPTTPNVDLAISNVDGIAPTDALAIVVSTSSSTARVNIATVAPVAPALTDRWGCVSTDGGTTWSTPTGATAVCFEAIGTISTQGP